MAVKKRCGFCNKHLVNAGTKESPIWQCKNEKCPRYVPDPKPVEPTPTEPTPETPSEPTATPSEGNTTPTVEAPSTGEPVRSEGESATNTNGGGNTETEPTP